MKRNYKQAGNPWIIYTAALQIIDQVRSYRGSKSSFQFAELLAYAAEMILSEGKSAVTLRRGLSLIFEAQETIARVPVISKEILRARVSYALHEGIILKALGYFDEAIRIMRFRANNLESHYDVSDIETVSLSRQEVIMQQDKRAFARLAENAALYRDTHPAEYYGTLRRIFEYLLNTRRLDQAKAMHDEHLRAFRQIAYKLPQLSSVTFAKNEGYYQALAVSERQGEALLGDALVAAQRLQLFGQERQIRSMLHNQGSVERIGLQVFKV